MIMSSVSCVEWHWMGRRRTFLWKHGPALFVHCGTSSIMPAPIGQYDFQLRRNGCLAKLGQGKLCKPGDYPYLPTFKCCSESQLQGVPGFLGFWVFG